MAVSAEEWFSLFHCISGLCQCAIPCIVVLQHSSSPPYRLAYPPVQQNSRQRPACFASTSAAADNRIAELQSPGAAAPVPAP